MPQTDNTFIYYVANNGSNDLLSTLTFSPTVNGGWGTSSAVSGQSSLFGPAICDTANGALMAYIATNGSNDIIFTTFPGSSWTPGQAIPANPGKPKGPFIQSQHAPAVTNFDESAVLLAYVGASNILQATTSNGFEPWAAPQPVTGNQSSKFAPALAKTGNNTIVLAYVANNSSNDLLATTSTNGGASWTPSVKVGTQSSSLGPALIAFGNELVIAYVANNGSNDLLVTTSTTSGASWTPSVKVGTQSSKQTPALGALNNLLVMAYVANNNSNDLLVTTSTNGGASWTPNTSVTGQSTAQRPALLCIESD
jgi:hypothetical protein